jgi:hypothetical protein
MGFTKLLHGDHEIFSYTSNLVYEWIQFLNCNVKTIKLRKQVKF